jgi:hypothetical protein
LYEELMNKNIVLTLVTADQILSSSESSFSASEIIEQFGNLNNRSDWVCKEDVLPANMVMKNGKSCYDPVLEECRRMVNNGEE